MHYYTFNIGDYMRDTAHLDDMEDLAYRRMLDLYYLKEMPLPRSHQEIAKLIRMRTHTESIANVLREFFILTDLGYVNSKADSTLNRIYDKSDKARTAAEKRWSKNKDIQNADAMQTHSDSNADGMLPINLLTQQPINPICIGDSKESPPEKSKKTVFKKPTLQEVDAYMQEINKGSFDEASKFVDFYESKGWLVGKAKMKDWKAAVRNWTKNKFGGFTHGNQNGAGLNRGERLQQWCVDATEQFKQQIAELEQQESAGNFCDGNGEFIAGAPDLD